MMDKALEHLNHLVQTGQVSLKDFYMVAVYRDRIIMQGHNTIANRRRYNTVPGNRRINGNGYLVINLNKLDTAADIIAVEIVLT